MPLPSRTHPQKQNLVVYTKLLTDPDRAWTNDLLNTPDTRRLPLLYEF